ncbi:hypothetical protein [Streptomyces sp. NPDC050548]|uniref:hypothetical protein n=1 Tax=Streptomyces sp. NPDC050548 TaxID=3365629 RepID=UPI00379453BC
MSSRSASCGRQRRTAGQVADARGTSPDVVGSRAVVELVGSHARLTGAALQTVGGKGDGGFARARVSA